MSTRSTTAPHPPIASAFRKCSEDPWARQPDEPARWYARFDVYRLLGPTRTIEATYRLIAQLENLTGSRPGQAWYAAAKTYDWQPRADAWDAHERQRLRAIDEDRRFDAREHRLTMIDRLLGAVFNVLLAANLDQMDIDQARAWLPTMRLLFKDLLNAQRTDLGLPAIADTADATLTPFTADDLIAAQAHLDRWSASHSPTLDHLLTLRNVLAALYPDEPSARRIAHQAGLSLSRIHFSPTALDTWHAILTEADHTDAIEDLIAVVKDEYAANRDLRTAINHYRSQSRK